MALFYFGLRVLLQVQGVTGHVSKVPAIAGSEGVGIITAVGSSITAFKVNDKVVPSRLGFGGCECARAASICSE
jgi:NADPH:quinone reductase-like Zn-dependent oxidoreductase